MCADATRVAALLDIVAAADSEAARAAALVRVRALVDDERRSIVAAVHPAAVESALDDVSPRARRACEIALERHGYSDLADRGAQPSVRLSRATSTALLGIVTLGADAAPRRRADAEADRLALGLLYARQGELDAIARGLGLVEIAFVCSQVERVVAGRVLRLADADAVDVERWSALAPAAVSHMVERSADRIAALAARGLCGPGVASALGRELLAAALSRAETALASAALSRFPAPPPASMPCDDAWLGVADAVARKVAEEWK
jgi:hypothetical protein